MITYDSHQQMMNNIAPKLGLKNGMSILEPIFGQAVTFIPLEYLDDMMNLRWDIGGGTFYNKWIEACKSEYVDRILFQENST